MNLFNKFIYLSALALICTFFTPPAWAKDCIQKRNTPQAPDNIYKQSNPLEATVENISIGKKLYQKEAKPLACYQCHGTTGNGEGMMARGMTPRPRDFSCQTMMKALPDGQLFWVIKNGSAGTGMMGFKTLNDKQIWQMVSYIRQFAK
ncbi:MAG: c-type cytochrome [Nitrospina sp.]|nr:c-type cytochrome [Nitrospina sp.]